MSGQKTKLRFYNTLGRSLEDFVPLDPEHIRVYVCGPTVYDRIHVGNARPLVVFDTLVRLLRYHYRRVTYIRNITDIDDKINARAAERGISIANLTETTTRQFHEDCHALGAIPPDEEPRATAHLDAMLAMITTLIEKGHAYVAEGHVLFAVSSMEDYGALSRRSQDELIAGARVEVAPYKRSPADFVLWKPSDAATPGWESPWGRGRPGWHIECSAMSATYLGAVFDIHGGGLDLVFPHHENEIAQSRCAHGSETMARFWMHNGYVTVGGEKMAKSAGNFVTVADALASQPGEAVRYALLAAHYRAPLDFTLAGVAEARTALDSLYRAAAGAASETAEPDSQVLAALADDLNTPKAFARLHQLARQANRGDAAAAGQLRASAGLLGLLEKSADVWFQQGGAESGNIADDAAEKNRLISELVEARNTARRDRDFATADQLRDKLKAMGVVLEDRPDGSTGWRRDPNHLA